MIDWYARCDYELDIKRRFHAEAHARLRLLATSLGLPPGSFDLRSNAGGITVSGEITLHHDGVYVQVSQPATGADSGILIRTARAGATIPAVGTILHRCDCSTTFPPWRSKCAR